MWLRTQLITWTSEFLAENPSEYVDKGVPDPMACCLAVLLSDIDLISFRLSLPPQTARLPGFLAASRSACLRPPDLRSSHDIPIVHRPGRFAVICRPTCDSLSVLLDGHRYGF